MPKSPRSALSPRRKAMEKEESEDFKTLRENLAKLVTEPPEELVAALEKPLVADERTASAMVVDRLCYEVEQRGFVHGIFRVAGGGFKTKALVLACMHLSNTDDINFKSEVNVHNIAAALTLYLSKTVVLEYKHYQPLFAALQSHDKAAPEEQARALSAAMQSLPKRTVIQRVMKLLCDCAAQSQENQMTAKNLAIVFAPVIFHDEAEPLAMLAATQGAKMTLLEMCISHYALVFPLPLTEVYKPPPRPGQVPLLTERDWALLTAKHCEMVLLEAGDVLLEPGQVVSRLYRVKSGSLVCERSYGHKKQRLIPGDFLGFRTFLGRTRSEGRFLAEDEVELWSLSLNHVNSIWEVALGVGVAFFGNVALAYALELRGQEWLNEQSIAQHRLSLMMVGGMRYSTILNEEEQAQTALEQEQEELHKSLLPATSTPPSDAVVVSAACLLDKRPGRVSVTALNLRFESEKSGLGAKVTIIPYEAFERISTNVPDEVIRGKQHASKVYSRKKATHTITLTVRKRTRNRSFKQSSKVLYFFCQHDAAVVFSGASKLFLTVSEEALADPARRFKQPPLAPSDSSAENTIVSKAVALFDYQEEDAKLQFEPGDILYLTSNRKDLRVKARLESDPTTFAMVPRDYVEQVVWVHNIKGLPTEDDIHQLFSCGTRSKLMPDDVALREGVLSEGSLYLVASGVLKVTQGGRHTLGYLCRGDIFGEVAFLVGGASSATVVAYTEVEVLEVAAEVVRATFAVRQDLAAKFYKLFAATSLRRIEKNRLLPYQERKRASVMFSTTRTPGKRKDSILLDALL